MHLGVVCIVELLDLTLRRPVPHPEGLAVQPGRGPPAEGASLAGGSPSRCANSPAEL